MPLDSVSDMVYAIPMIDERNRTEETKMTTLSDRIREIAKKAPANQAVLMEQLAGGIEAAQIDPEVIGALAGDNAVVFLVRAYLSRRLDGLKPLPLNRATNHSTVTVIEALGLDA